MKLEKKISLSWKRYPVGFKLGKKSSSSNSIFQTGELEKSSSDRLNCEFRVAKKKKAEKIWQSSAESRPTRLCNNVYPFFNIEEKKVPTTAIIQNFQYFKETNLASLVIHSA